MDKNTDTAPRPRYWMGSAVGDCDICKKPIVKRMVDGATRMGPWGLMCVSCHDCDGVGLGQGRGQAYEKQDDGRWLKIAGFVIAALLLLAAPAHARWSHSGGSHHSSYSHHRR